MKRIDVDNYLILYIEEGDHCHRYAVPTQWTVGQTANRVHDGLWPRTRKPAERYTLLNLDRCVDPDTSIVKMFTDGAYATVVQLQQST